MGWWEEGHVSSVEVWWVRVEKSQEEGLVTAYDIGLEWGVVSLVGSDLPLCFS